MSKTGSPETDLGHREGYNNMGVFAQVQDARDYAGELEAAATSDPYEAVAAVYYREGQTDTKRGGVTPEVARTHLEKRFAAELAVAMKYGCCSMQVGKEMAKQSDSVVQGFVDLCAIAGVPAVVEQLVQ
jgi:hypothetical protein